MAPQRYQQIRYQRVHESMAGWVGSPGLGARVALPGLLVCGNCAQRLSPVSIFWPGSCHKPGLGLVTGMWRRDENRGKRGRNGDNWHHAHGYTGA
jgi:hypothetical protein